MLYLTYKVDPHDTLVGHVVGWLRTLARRMDSIEVVCLAAGPAELPPNVSVHSLCKERGANRLARWLCFYRTVWGLRHQIEAVFCQFSPEYVIGVAPLARLCGWPITFWYTHRHVGLRLRLATALADRVLTATTDSFQLQTPKLRVIGHGIDTERFRPGPAQPAERPIVLAVGRRAPIKRYELLIDATRILTRDLGQNLQVRIVGGDEGSAPSDYARQLQQRIDSAGLSDVVKLVGALPFDRVTAEYRRASVHVNLCPTGGMDKAVLEGMASGVPTLVRNETFAPYLNEAGHGLVFAADEPRAVAEQIAALLALSAAERARLGQQLQQIAGDNFGQAAFIARLAAAIAAPIP
ncbi:MAG: glycosyltransferase family 4 protein [Anaerolineales bacterium]